MKKLTYFVLILCLVIFFPISVGDYVKADGSIGEDITVSIAKNLINEFNDYYKDRNPGTEGEKQAGRYLRDKLYNAGYLGYFNGNYESVFYYKDKTSQNIAGVYNSQKENCIIIGAHYDAKTSSTSFGINDNASGVVASLMLLDKLKTLDYKIIVCFYGAEEDGMVGSKYFVDYLLKNKENVLLSINFDTLVGDNSYYFTTDKDAKYKKYVDGIFSDSETVRQLSGDRLNSIYDSSLGQTHIGLKSDNISYLNKNINSIFFFGGAFESLNGLGCYEKKGKETLIHKNDTIEKNEEYFDFDFYRNIYYASENAFNLISSEGFKEAMSKPYDGGLTLWAIKGIVAGVVIIFFASILTTIIFINKRKEC